MFGRTKTTSIDITPDPSLMLKMGVLGTSVSAAIAELCDNAIEARRTDATLKIWVEAKQRSISVQDNGKGMDKETAKDALILGKSGRDRTGKGLSQYGLGLKTASLSLGEYVKVSTTQEFDKDRYEVVLDADEWKEKNGWSVPMVLKNKENPKNHGTYILIKKLKKTVYSYAIQNLRGSLSRAYRHFLKNGEVEIWINRKKCIAENWENQIEAGTKRIIKIDLKGGKKISGWCGLLKSGSFKSFGFDLIWKNRLMKPFAKFGISADASKGGSKFVGELHLNHLRPNANKTGFVQTDADYEEAEKLISESPVVKEVRNIAKKSASETSISKKIIRNRDKWLNALRDTLSDKSFDVLFGKAKMFRSGGGHRLNAVPGTKAMVKVEQRNKVGGSGGPDSDDYLVPEYQRKPKKTHMAWRHTIRINKRDIQVEHDFDDLGAEGPFKQVVDHKDYIKIITNKSFPLWVYITDQGFLTAIHMAEGVSEVLAERTEMRNFNEMENMKSRVLRGMEERFRKKGK